MPDNTPAWQAAAQITSSAIGATAQSSINQKTRNYNREMYDKQRGHALEDWAMQNQYNHPSSQMARLREAGLNPNLVYGHGANAESTSPPRASTAQAWNPKAPDYSGVSQAALGYMSVKMQQATIDNLRAQNTVIEQERWLKAAQTIATMKSGEKTGVETQHLNEVTDLIRSNMIWDMDAKMHGVEKIEADTKRIGAETKTILDRNEREEALKASTIHEAAQRILNMRRQNSKSLSEQAEIDKRIEVLGQTIRLMSNKISGWDDIDKGSDLWEQILNTIVNKIR